MTKGGKHWWRVISRSPRKHWPGDGVYRGGPGDFNRNQWPGDGNTMEMSSGIPGRLTLRAFLDWQRAAVCAEVSCPCRRTARGFRSRERRAARSASKAGRSPPVVAREKFPPDPERKKGTFAKERSMQKRKKEMYAKKEKRDVRKKEKRYVCKKKKKRCT